MQGWMMQTDKIIKKNLQEAIMRLEIDSSLFFFKFMGQTSPEVQSRLESHRFLSLNRPITSVGKEDVVDDSIILSKVRLNSDETLKSREAIIPPINKETQSSEQKVKSSWSIFKTVNEARKTMKKRKSSKRVAPDDVAVAFAHFLKEKKLDKNYLSGYSVAYDILKYSKGNRLQDTGQSTFFWSLIRALIPTFYRIYLVYHKKENIMIFTNRPEVVALVAFINFYFC